MALWNCYPHPDLLKWVIIRARKEYPGLLQSFEAACAYAANESNWANVSGQYAFVDYLPGDYPFTYSMIIKLQVDAVSIIAVAIAMEREGLAYIAM